ncbi:Rpn family recombination-promoting nuclease/putative transposase [Oribacterium parvum]|uniref:Rpn family recombination-promoting nuclease/putative transposase n=1 Tax=Oribacterium parvum TaxID=1501329 RepID=UPI0028E2651E|nr:Rpn family recombination-promoting nuclease/putative transposase [Oribacterium parvum]
MPSVKGFSKSKEHLSPEQKFLSELILMDDIFMRIVLKDRKCTEFILQTILQKPDLRVKTQSIQSDLKNLQGRSLILDCLCSDTKGTVYNIEVQNDSHGASPKRARYHSGLIDMHILKKGKTFETLPESYVIFICAKDILKENKQIYHISRIIQESGKKFPDQAEIIYLNTSKDSENELGKLIEDFYTKDPKKMHSKVLAKRVADLKENKNIEKGEHDAMTTYYDRLKKQWEKEGIAKGIIEGKAKGSAESESKMAKLMGFLVREGRIADIEKASESPDYRKALLQEFQLS